MAMRSVVARVGLKRAGRGALAATYATQLTPSVSFDTIAREWRCKWSPEDDKASLEAAQQVLAKHLADIKAVTGVKSVQRTVCGGCLDIKVATALGDSDFGAWEEAGFSPEATVLEELKAIPGITLVETQT